MIEERTPGRWAGTTSRQAAQKLIAAAHEAGLLDDADPRRPVRPVPVPDLALAYVMHLLRGIRFAGDPLDNVYLASLDLRGEALVDRLQQLGPLGVRLRPDRRAAVFADPDVVSWARHTFTPVIG